MMRSIGNASWWTSYLGDHRKGLKMSYLQQFIGQESVSELVQDFLREDRKQVMFKSNLYDDDENEDEEEENKKRLSFILQLIIT